MISSTPVTAQTTGTFGYGRCHLVSQKHTNGVTIAILEFSLLTQKNWFFIRLECVFAEILIGSFLLIGNSKISTVSPVVCFGL